jgi:hypothetical protein
VRAHTVKGQQQQHGQQEQELGKHLQPSVYVRHCDPHKVQLHVQQVVVVIPTVAVHVGPITLALPGYALLLRFAGRNGGISYTSFVDTATTHSLSISFHL